MSRAIIVGKDTPDGCSATVVRPDKCWPAYYRPIETDPTWWFRLGARRSSGRMGGRSCAACAAGRIHRSQARRSGPQEFAAGALASGGRVVLNDDVVEA